MQQEIVGSQAPKKLFSRVAALVLTGASMLSLLSGCGGDTNIRDVLHPTEIQATETVVTEPPATSPPDGDPENISCKGTYTTENFDGNQVVARIEDQELNNNKLNILYRLAVNGYQAEEGQPSPDFSKPLDSQVCELEGDHITWQQYFLQQALDGWSSIQGLERRSHLKMVRNELNFAVDHERHDKYMVDVPVNDTVLYGEDASFRLSRQEKPYMEKLPESMAELAGKKGYSSLQEMVRGEFGPSVTEKDFNDLVYLANYAYLYFISLSYDPKPTDEELGEIMKKMPEAWGSVVDMRHILLISDQASIGEDGKLIADEAGWADTYNQALYVLKLFRNGKRRDEVGFSVYAHDYTRDEGSRLSGGLYTNIHKGQMVKPLDDWLFDPARQPGDTDLVKTDYGWHAVYFSGRRDERIPEAKRIFREQKMQLIMDEIAYNYPVTIEYDKIQLQSFTENQGQLTMSQDLLYADVGHERFPEVPVYIQQDYAKAPYGGFKVSSHGCGISAFAMLSTYMMDEPHTPATLGVQFGHFNGLHGTDMRMFTDAPPELGYYLYKRSGIWQDVEDNLRAGRMTISLQVKGYFTRAGHYLVLSELADDGRVVVRDSNVYNYQRLPEHKLDLFEHKKLLPNCKGFWIYDNKVVTVPSCARCGHPHAKGMPRLFEEGYLCHKCQPAVERRTVFMDLCRMN